MPKPDQSRPPRTDAPPPARPGSVRPARVTPTSLAGLAKELEGVHGGARIARDEAPEAEVSGITNDSRDVRPGDLYAALPGARVHGADFTAQVVEAGAAALLTDEEGARRAREAFAAGTPEVPLLIEPDPRAVMGAAAARIYGHPADALTLVGITGTNGKSTTGFLAHGALSHGAHAEAGLVGGVEIRLGGEHPEPGVPAERTTPEATQLHALFAAMRERGTQSAAMEVSSHALVFGRVDGAVFDVAVFNNLTPEHLDFHADMEDYFRAKAQLFTPHRARRGIVNIDDAYGRRLAEEVAEIPVQTYSATGDPDADWRATDVELRPGGSTFTVHAPDGACARASVELPGPFNVANALAAIAAATTAGRPLAEAVAGVAAVPGVPGRMERVDGPEGSRVLGVVDFAHKPDALENALTALREVTPGKLLVVVGAGGDRDQLKRPHMGAAAARLADTAILTSDNPRTEDALAILVQLLEGAARVPERQRGNVLMMVDREEAIRSAVRRARPGDTVLVAGKGHEVGQYVGGEVRPFDDREVLGRALHELSGPPPTDGAASPKDPKEQQS
ncbi:UDP-N-acetylmuramoyl-L-alanyl-D-glutamate--2,6-diaminopimelate ligase [Mangrovactinospora gilvigrisea]|uniref:UDP-N-acetylmuramoyl-L-alanyl-D-glutamate--2,6-diaminopimelate ligase n=1 Tax=Mangrovactinospora gilvigrisea TaxID=1428644 RepID=A0A1J7BHN3_9ACTN|nr:UDP-N-acetylmuramoyl-L-alanyl-D-glutamate--2,6-diaminopimelate ligase [Mangrovactinospora gilvigrisea]OIV38166.1 UDP-N-acetylmuramoyl-L-alanyl-D-glutamate--2,6-diaminopimelate ligase [Mangrovactinospora gilvigrisea]